jgi:DNA-binding response OmpR family regulator
LLSILPALASDSAHSESPPAPGKRCVLVVDDEPLLLKGIERSLEARGFEVMTALDAEDALRVSRNVTKLDLLVTDVFLPGTDGVALATLLSEARPGLPVLFISGLDAGLDAGPVAGRLAAIQRWAFLAKPFRHRELDTCLAELLA